MRAPWTMDIDAFPRLGRRGAEFSAPGRVMELDRVYGFDMELRAALQQLERLRCMLFARRHLCELAECVEWLRTLYGQELPEDASNLA